MWSEIGDTCTLFDIFIYLAAIYCRYYGYEGVITNKIPAVMDTLGYDFNSAYLLLKQRLASNPIIDSNKELKDLMINMQLSNIDSVDIAYESIVKIRDIIIDGYVNATTMDEYNAIFGESN